VAEDEQHRPRREGYDVGRLLALSDGVFAIAMTLLVLDIPAPGSLHSDARLVQALGRVLPNVLTFGLSFALVALYWMAHRRLFRDLARTSMFLVQLNVVLLLLVCLVPFTSAVLSRDGDLPTAILVYAGNLAALGLVMTGLQVESWRSDLLVPRPTPAENRVVILRSIVGTAVFLASMVVAVFNTGLAPYLWLALLVVGPVLGLLRRLSATRRRAGRSR
jgi:TMEM175 potassium channel family protein